MVESDNFLTLHVATTWRDHCSGQTERFPETHRVARLMQGNPSIKSVTLDYRDEKPYAEVAMLSQRFERV